MTPPKIVPCELVSRGSNVMRIAGSLYSCMEAILRGELFRDPIGDGAFQIVETIVEEMAGPGNDDEAHLGVLRQFRRHLFYLFGLAEFVELAVDQEQWLATG